MRRRGGFVAVVLLAALFNLPLLHLAWLGHRLDSDGVEVTGTVVDSRVADGRGESGQRLITYTFDERLDPDQLEWQVDMSEEGFARAEATGLVSVRVLPDELAVSEVEGQRTSRIPLILTVVGDLFLLAFAILLWRRRPEAAVLRLRAVADVERAKPAESLQELPDGDYLVTGEVVLIADDRLDLQVGDRVVRIDLAGHRNEIGYQQTARVHARPSERLSD